jgi:hypothetical protein
MLVGLVAPQVRPAGAVSAMLIVPVNPFTAVTVIDEVSDEPTFEADGEAAETVKSVAVSVAVVEWVRLPLIPVIVTTYVPAVVELHDSVAVAVGGTVTLLGEIDPQVRPDGAVSVSVTAPVKLPKAVTVMVDVADVLTIAVVGEVALIVKSFVVLNVTMVEWESVPLVAVIVTVNVFAVLALQVSVAVPELVTLVGVIALHVSPVGTVSVRLTIPVNPLSAVTVMVEVKETPGEPAAEVADSVKSVMVNVTEMEWDNEPLVPVILSV